MPILCKLKVIYNYVNTDFIYFIRYDYNHYLIWDWYCFLLLVINPAAVNIINEIRHNGKQIANQVNINVHNLMIYHNLLTNVAR